MPVDTGRDESAALSPDEAFGVLGNETRVRILRELWDGNEPLSFTELRNRVGFRQGGQFNYHLEKVVGHFVEKSEEGYVLRTPGSRVVQAVLSGAVTEDPVLSATRLDRACYHCGAPVLVAYSGHLSVYCTRCAGNYAGPPREMVDPAADSADPDRIGMLAGLELPPAGLEGRDADDLLRAGTVWQTLERFAARAGLCPHCSARVEESVEVCGSHDADDGACEECGRRYAVLHGRACTNCNYARRALFGRLLLAETALLEFVAAHGIDPLAPADPMALMAVIDGSDEDVVSTDPFEVRFTFAIDDEALTLTVGGDLSVVEVGRSAAGE